MNNEKKEYTVEELLAQIDIMKKTIQVQHETINRLMDTYVLKTKPAKQPKSPRKQYPGTMSPKQKKTQVIYYLRLPISVIYH